MKKAKVNLRDGLGNNLSRGFDLESDTTQAQFGQILTDYSALTACGVLGGKATEKLPDLVPTGFTATSPHADSRYYREGRMTVALAPHTNGAGQSVGTINIPGIKAALASNGAIVDSGGLIAAFLTHGLASGKLRLSDGQALASASIISGYVENLEHPDSENVAVAP